MVSAVYFTMPGQYWVRSRKFLVEFYWPKLERDSDALGSLAVILLVLETDIFNIVANYPQLEDFIIDLSQFY